MQEVLENPAVATAVLDEATPVVEETKSVSIDSLTLDHAYQTRVKVSEEKVAEYQEAIEKGAKRKGDPIMVYRVTDPAKEEGGKPETVLLVVDGFHWITASERAGKKRVDAVIRDGTRTDALRYALSANPTHGLARTTADKERAVKLCLADPKLGKLSTVTIAKLCYVSQGLTARVREQWDKDHPSDGEKRVGADGKSRKKSIARKDAGARATLRAAKDAAVKLASATGEAATRIAKPKKGVVDDIQLEVPEPLLAIWAGKVNINGIVRILENVVAQVGALRTSGALAWASKAVEQNLKAALEEISDSAPSVVDASHKNGFLSVGQYAALKAQEKRDLQARLAKEALGEEVEEGAEAVAA